MRDLIPCGNTVVCKKITSSNDEIEKENNGFVVKESIVPVYEIVDYHFLTEKDCSNFNFVRGDKIISASTGTKVVLDDETFWLFKPEHITSKIIAP